MVDAVVLGLGGMVGAGLFAGFAPAAAAAGWWLLPALLLPAVLAWCAVTSTSAQSTACPGIGGGYLATREYLGAWPARLTGSLDVAAKAAAGAAIAGVLGQYVYPPQPWVAALTALALSTALNGLRITWPPSLNRVLLGVALAVLGVIVAAGFAVAASPAPVTVPAGPSVRGLPGAAGMLFFALLGFERITGRDSADGLGGRTRRRAGQLAVGIGLVLYLVVGSALLHQLGADRLALSPAPLRDLLAAADASALQPLLLLGAPCALLPVLAWVQGSLREVLQAMRGHGDLWLPGVKKNRSHPRIDVLAGVLAGVLAVLLSPAQAMTFAAACALGYYMFTNAAARVMLREENPWPTRTACLGMVLSVVLVMTLPVADLGATLAVAAVGAGVTAVSGRLTRYRSRL